MGTPAYDPAILLKIVKIRHFVTNRRSLDERKRKRIRGSGLKHQQNFFKSCSENTASLPELMELLLQTEVVGELQTRSERRKTPNGHLEKELQTQDSGFLEKLNRDATLSAQAETSEIFSLLTEFDKLKGSHLLAGLRSIRNELFAHTAIERNRNNPARYGDAESLLDKTLQFVSRLNSAVINLHCSYQDHIQTWQEHADFFWKYTIGKEIEKPRKD